jgi:hypothetical protein
MVIIKWAKWKIDNMDRKYAALQNEPDQISIVALWYHGR